MVGYALVFLGAALVALALTPAVARLSRAMRILDRPGTRKVHATAVPRVGGVAVVLAMLVVIVPVFLMKGIAWEPLRLIQSHLQPMGRQVLVLLSASVFICLVGNWSPGTFDFMHMYFWQVAMILIIVSVWVLWIEKVVHYERKAVAVCS